MDLYGLLRLETIDKLINVKHIYIYIYIYLFTLVDVFGRKKKLAPCLCLPTYVYLLSKPLIDLAF